MVHSTLRAGLQKVSRGQICSAPPLNNHTHILYFLIDAGHCSGGFTYQRRIIPVIPCSDGRHSLFLIIKEFTCTALKLIDDLMSKIANQSKNSQIPCYFSSSPGIRGE